MSAITESVENFQDGSGCFTMSIMRGSADDWDGTAALYCILVEYRGMEPYLVPGVMDHPKKRLSESGVRMTQELRVQL